VRTGTNLTHVPYKGGGPMTTALMAGEIQLAFTNPATIIGTIKAAGCALLPTTARRARPAAGVPTMTSPASAAWKSRRAGTAYSRPRRTPATSINRLHAEIRTRIADRGVRDAFVGLNVQADGRTPAEFRTFVVEAIRRYAELVKLAGIPRNNCVPDGATQIGRPR
jgi:tripartite-type tricarboxylate transporter receptor subunit TctC